MALVISDLGCDEILKAFFNNQWPSSKDLTLKLYSNDKTPADTDTASDYTEVSGGGYSSKTLSNGYWTISPSNDPSDAVYDQQTFTFTGPIDGSGKVYGYYIVNANGVLLWAERFTVYFQPANNGDQIKITPRIQLSKGTPS